MGGSAQRAQAPGDPTLAERTVLVIEDNMKRLDGTGMDFIGLHRMAASTAEGEEHSVYRDYGL